MKKRNILFILFFVLTKVFSQEFKAGLILPNNPEDYYSEAYCCILSPLNGFIVYDKPKGKPIGVLKRITLPNPTIQYEYTIYIEKPDDTIPFSNYREIGYEIFALNFIDYSENYVKLDSEKSYWLSVGDIEKNDFKIEFWRDFLIKKSEDVLGYYAKEPGLNVRKGPGTHSEKIGSVRGDLFEIKLTSEINSNWCKAIITKYKEHPCNTGLEKDENIEFRYEGWIKLIDDNGEPNVWNYTRGC